MLEERENLARLKVQPNKLSEEVNHGFFIEVQQ